MLQKPYLVGQHPQEVEILDRDQELGTAEGPHDGDDYQAMIPG